MLSTFMFTATEPAYFLWLYLFARQFRSVKCVPRVSRFASQPQYPIYFPSICAKGISASDLHFP